MPVSKNNENRVVIYTTSKENIRGNKTLPLPARMTVRTGEDNYRKEFKRKDCGPACL